jgi:DinB family protein
MENGFSNVSRMFKANTDIINKATADVANEDWYRKPGDESNDLLWLMGHVIVHRGQTLHYLGEKWDAPWASLFAPGAERADDGAYPTREELGSAWSQVCGQLSAALRNASPEFLANDAPAGPPSFDGKVSGTVAFFAFHDTYHTGQISFLRKWLGYGRTIG